MGRTADLPDWLLVLHGMPVLHRLPALPEADAGLPLGATDAALLALLALDGPASRGRLATWLWPQGSPSVALGNLRQRLYRLQRRCNDNLVQSQGDQLSLSIRVRVQPAPGEDAGPWAPDANPLGPHDYPHLPQLHAWVEALRSRWRQQQRAQLQQSVAAHQARGNLSAAISLLQLAAADHPMDEGLARQLMQLHHAQGDRVALQQVFHQISNALRRELGVLPAAETVALHRQLLRNTTLPAAPAHTGPLSAAAQDLLHLAAVAGDRLGVGLATRAMACTALRLVTPWQELQAAGWFDADGPVLSPAIQALQATLPPPVLAHLQAWVAGQTPGIDPVPVGGSHAGHGVVTPRDTGPG